MMNGTIVRQILQGLLPAREIRTLARQLNVVQRQRSLDVVSLIVALVLNGGSEEQRGRLSQIHREYLAQENVAAIGVSGFNARFTRNLCLLVLCVLHNALQQARAQPVFLNGTLASVPGQLVDWLLVDSETVRLRRQHRDTYDNGQDGSALKVHKVYSLGRSTMIDVRLSPSREHDNKHFTLIEEWRHHGLLLDLAYASMQLLADCERLQIRYVIRLKSNWKPRVSGQLFRDYYDEIEPAVPFGLMVEQGELVLDGRPHDLDVVCGSANIASRLVGVPVAKDDGSYDYLFYLTNLHRSTHSPRQVGDIYRCRWEIETDNKVDKSGSRLDHTCHARSLDTLHTLIAASLLHTIMAGMLTHQHRLALVRRKKLGQRPPLHPLLVALAITSLKDILHRGILQPQQVDWDRIADKIERVSHDRNWRSRPSVLDTILGSTAPPGRRRNLTFEQCPPEATPFMFRSAA